VEKNSVAQTLYFLKWKTLDGTEGGNGHEKRCFHLYLTEPRHPQTGFALLMNDFK